MTPIGTCVVNASASPHLRDCSRPCDGAELGPALPWQAQDQGIELRWRERQRGSLACSGRGQTKGPALSRRAVHQMSDFANSTLVVRLPTGRAPVGLRRQRLKQGNQIQVERYLPRLRPRQPLYSSLRCRLVPNEQHLALRPSHRRVDKGPVK